MKYLLLIFLIVSMDAQASAPVDAKAVDKQLESKEVNLKTKIDLHRQNAQFHGKGIVGNVLAYIPSDDLITYLKSDNLDPEDFRYLLSNVKTSGEGDFLYDEAIKSIDSFYETILAPNFKALEMFDIGEPPKPSSEGKKKLLKAIETMGPKLRRVQKNKRIIESNYRAFLTNIALFSTEQDWAFEKIDRFTLEQKLSALVQILGNTPESIQKNLTYKSSSKEPLFMFLKSIIKDWAAKKEISQPHQDVLSKVFEHAYTKGYDSGMQQKLLLLGVRFLGTPFYENAKELFLKHLRENNGVQQRYELSRHYDPLYVKIDWRSIRYPLAFQKLFNDSHFVSFIKDLLEDIKTGKVQNLEQSDHLNLVTLILSGDVIIHNWELAESALDSYLSQNEMPKEIMVRLFLSPSLPQKLKWLKDRISLNAGSQEILLSTQIGESSANISDLFKKDVLIGAMVLGALENVETYSEDFWFVIELGLAILDPEKHDFGGENRRNFFPAFQKLFEESKKDAVLNPTPYKIETETFNLNPSQYFKFSKDPFSGIVSLAEFKSLVHELVEALKTGSYDEHTIVCVSQSERSWGVGGKKPSGLADDIRNRLDSGLYDKFIDKMGIAATKMSKIIAYAQTLSPVSPGPGKLSPRNLLLFNLFQNMLSCSGGNLEAISAIYESVAKKIQEKSNLSLDDAIRFYLKRYHLNLFATQTDIVKLIMQSVGKGFNIRDETWHSHYTAVIRSLIGKEIGIAPPDSKPEFDQALWSGKLPDFVKAATKQGVLDTFLKGYNLNQALTRIFEMGKETFQKHGITTKQDLIKHMVSEGYFAKGQ